MKKTILWAITLVTLMVSLSGCFYGYHDRDDRYDRDRRDRHHDRDRDRDEDRYDRR